MDFRTCWQVSIDTCRSELHLDSVAANPATRFDPSAAETAFTRFEELARVCDPAVTAFAVSQGGLRTMLRGSRASGDSCTPPFPITIETAAAALASCENAAPCLGHGAPPIWRCTPQNAVGGDCFTDLNCLDGLYCPQTDPPNFALTCLQRKPQGSPCGLGNECDSLLCKGGVCADLNQQTAFCL
jgi:hypothetical protein